jgi:hypothetical protein
MIIVLPAVRWNSSMLRIGAASSLQGSDVSDAQQLSSGIKVLPKAFGERRTSASPLALTRTLSESIHEGSSTLFFEIKEFSPFHALTV